MSIPLPSKTKIILEEGNRGVFEIEGLYPGYGQTIGNSLRRVLLSSLQGAAITSVKIEGVGHEFSTIEGIKEDVVEILLNLKQLRFKMHEEGPFTIVLAETGEKKVSGKDFQTPSQVEIVNPEVPVATLTSKKASLRLEATVETGLGYVPVEARTKEKVEVGTIALDAAFSPVRHVNYEVENMRVGDRTDYNRLRLDITTDGTITPREALHKAVRILLEQFSSLDQEIAKTEAAPPSQEAASETTIKKEEAPKESESVLKMKLDALKLSSRTLNVLREAGIRTVGGVARKRESSLREIEGLGDKGIQEIKKALGNLGIILKQ